MVKKNKSDIKCRNTLGCLDEYVQRIDTVKQSGPEAAYAMKYVQSVEQSGLWTGLGYPSPQGSTFICSLVEKQAFCNLDFKINFTMKTNINQSPKP